MVNISKTKRNFIWWHTLFAVISGALGAVILHFALPGHYFGGYPFIPIYFYFFGLFSIYAFDACRRHAPQRMLLLYLATKMIKRSQSLSADVYLVLFDISGIRNLVLLLF